MTDSAILHDEWLDPHCSAFRPVLDEKRGRVWAWSWTRIVSGTALGLRSAEMTSLMEASDNEKDALRACYVERPDALRLTVETSRQQPQSKGHPLEIERTFTIEEPWDRCRLQFVLACYHTPHAAGMPPGRCTIDEGKYLCFVDRGHRSPWHVADGRPTGHPTLPYYYRPINMRWEVMEKQIRFYDLPLAAQYQDETYFEAVLVEISADGRPDRPLRVFQFGWVDRGRVRCPAPGAPRAGPHTRESDSVSDRFRQIVAKDYPDYDLTLMA